MRRTAVRVISLEFFFTWAEIGSKSVLSLIFKGFLKILGMRGWDKFLWTGWWGCVNGADLVQFTQAQKRVLPWVKYCGDKNKNN